MVKFYVRTTLERKLDKSFSQIEYELLIDREHNARKSFVEQLEYLATLDEDVVILEDDVILCRNFLDKINNVIEKYKENIINFFYSPSRYMKTQLQYVFCWNQCVYYPNKLLKLLAKEMRRWYTVMPNRPHDDVENIALSSLKLGNVVYRPCLVQHIDNNSLISVPGKRRTPFFIDYVEDMGLDYDSLTYANGMFELRGYAKKKFKELDEWK